MSEVLIVVAILVVPPAVYGAGFLLGRSHRSDGRCRIPACSCKRTHADYHAGA